jgi:hypothetical protein
VNRQVCRDAMQIYANAARMRMRLRGYENEKRKRRIWRERVRLGIAAVCRGSCVCSMVLAPVLYLRPCRKIEIASAVRPRRADGGFKATRGSEYFCFMPGLWGHSVAKRRVGRTPLFTNPSFRPWMELQNTFYGPELYRFGFHMPLISLAWQSRVVIRHPRIICVMLDQRHAECKWNACSSYVKHSLE